MYILVEEKDVKNAQVLSMFHERMPDGRLILPVSELKMLGSVSDCQIVASAKELKELISSGAENSLPEDGMQDDDNAPDTSEGIDAGGNGEEVPDGGQQEDTGSEEGMTDNGTAADGGENVPETEGGEEEAPDGTDVPKDDGTDTDTNNENQISEEVTDDGTGSTGRA